MSVAKCSPAQQPAQAGLLPNGPRRHAYTRARTQARFLACEYSDHLMTVTYQGQLQRVAPFEAESLNLENLTHG
jgi:hypothetical protein